MINVAILGFGVVGSGTADVLSRCQTRNNHRSQEHIQLKYILDRQDKPDSPYANQITKDFSVILADSSVQIVVETIGGTGAAYEMTKQALQAGKSVVTSNKELVAIHGHELLQIAQEKGCNYLFEAAVGGGIPIIRPLTTCLAANNIVEINGILNGTTNYILTRMIDAGLSFDDALKEAQDLGFAEQDPSADIDGKDACRKICILANMAYGNRIDPDQVSTKGLRNVTLEDVAYAQSLSCSIKLLGRARQEENGSLSVFVSPHFVPCTSPLYQVSDVFNAVSVTGDSLGESMFYGKGAGALPTASAVVADIIDLSRDLSTFRQNGWGTAAVTVNPVEQFPSMYYVRLNETVEKVTDHCKDSKLPLAALAHEDASKTESAFLTQVTTLEDVQATFQGLDVISILPFLT